MNKKAPPEVGLYVNNPAASQRALHISWIPFTEIINVVNAAKAGLWSWYRNTRCKYINVRIDMRDGSCIIFNRDGQQITLEQLQHQLQHSSTPATPAPGTTTVN